MRQKQTKQSSKQGKAIDWGEVHRRMENIQAAVERGFTPTIEEKEKILKARAKALAQEPKEQAMDAEYIEVVEFLLAYEKYGIELSYVREVYPLKALTPLPGTPPFVLGIINVRGQILSVIDLKKFFDLPEKGLTDLNKVIILHGDSMEFGILADVILDVRDVALNELESSLPTLTGIREKFLKGVTREGVVILDAVKMLSDKDIIIHEEVEA